MGANVSELRRVEPRRLSGILASAAGASTCAMGVVTIFMVVALVMKEARPAREPSAVEGRRPHSCPGPGSPVAPTPPTFRDAVFAAFRDQSEDGVVAFEKSVEMVVKKSELILARISEPGFDKRKLLQGIRNTTIRRIVASTKMRSTLSADSDALESAQQDRKVT